MIVDADERVPEVVRLTKMENAGDLVLFAARDKHGRVVNFQVEMGSHGGLHPDEQTAFLMVPPSVSIDMSGIKSARDLYPFFERYHA